MPIGEKDIKLLWGRAAGRCSNPACRTKVSATSHDGESYLTCEMAHIVAKKLGGPRAAEKCGPDTYDNLILLCPNCHTNIDKSPDGAFPVSILLEWKNCHEKWVESWATSPKFDSAGDLVDFIADALEDNEYYFHRYGPKSNFALNNPASTTHAIWVARKLDTIIPNNKKIAKALKENHDLLPISVRHSARTFVDHAQAFELSQYERLEEYPLFPEEFSNKIFKLRRS